MEEVKKNKRILSCNFRNS